jgi:hypothetical protein
MFVNLSEEFTYRRPIISWGMIAGERRYAMALGCSILEHENIQTQAPMFVYVDV